VGFGVKPQSFLLLNNAADAASFFDHVLGDAFAPVGAFYECPDVVFAFASGIGEQNICCSFCRNEFVWTTGQFDDRYACGQAVHDFEHMPYGAAKWFFTEFASGARAEKKQFVECQTWFSGDHDDFAGFARDECAAQKHGQTTSEAPIAKTRDAVQRTNVRPHGAREDFRIEVVEAREFGITET
jgi:hypothetical protein